MPKSRFKLPPLKLAAGTPGARIAYFRKARGITQTELAHRIGIIQSLISDYEQGRRRLYAEMIIRIAQALQVSTDEILGVKPTKANGEARASLRLTRRMQGIDALPAAKQKALLATIDAFLKSTGP